MYKSFIILLLCLISIKSFGGNISGIVKEVGTGDKLPGVVVNIKNTKLNTSPICYNSVHAFNPNNPINYDTTGNYVNYNVPVTPPDFTTSKASDAFFTNVNYIGAFAGTGTSAANWMNGWCEFNPLDANYDIVSTGVTALPKVTFNSAKLYPNPATQNTSVVFEMQQLGNVSVVLVDITGKVVKHVFNGNKNAGAQKIDIDLSDLNTGLYFVNIISESKQKTLKLSVVK